VKVAGQRTYLYRAVDQHRQVIDVLLSARRDLAAARRFLTRALPAGTVPAEVTTGRAPPEGPRRAGRLGAAYLMHGRRSLRWAPASQCRCWGRSGQLAFPRMPRARSPRYPAERHAWAGPAYRIWVGTSAYGRAEETLITVMPSLTGQPSGRAGDA